MPKPLTFDPHPGLAMVQAWISSLKSKTGRSLDEWLSLARKSGPKDEPSLRAWFKSAHNLPTNSAWWLAERTFGKGTGEDSPEAYLASAARYVNDQYSAKRAPLRPIFDALYHLSRSLGKDVRICPAKTIVPIYRRHVIAQIKPSTNTRVDFGLCLTTYKGKLPKRLVDTGGLAKKDRITHRFELTTPAQVDPDVARYLKLAYDLDT